MENITKEEAKNLPKLGFIASKHMDWILMELKKNKKLEANAMSKKM